MFTIRFQFAGGNGRTSIYASAAFLAAVFGLLVFLAALPAVLFGHTLSAEEAEKTIRAQLVARTITPGEVISDIEYEKRTAPIKIQRYEEVRVGTIFFSLFRMNRRHVARVRTKDQAGGLQAAYHCFFGGVYLGECSALNWYLAW